MKLSIVVPVYNVEAYLRQCVDSLLQQTVPAYEIILVDDGSKDNSGRICDEYAAKYPELVKAVHKANAGLGMARNTGMEHVTGEYVVFVDSDDFCQPDMVEVLSSVVEETGCDTCKTSFNRVDLQGQFLSAEQILPGHFTGSDVMGQVLPRIIGSAPDKKDSLPLSACCTVYSMKLIRENDLWFVSEREWISEDTVFNIDYYSKAQNVVLSPYIGYNYRTNPNSLSTGYKADRFEKCLAMYHKEIQVLTDLGIYEQCRYRLVRQFFNFLRICFKQLKPRVCGMNGREIRREIRRICGNESVQKMIREYPVGQLGIPQQAFVYMVKYRLAALLYLAFGR